MELGLYLAVTRSRKEIEESGLGETEQKRLKSHGPSPGITTAEILQRRRMNRTKGEDGEESCREEEDDESQDIGTQTERKFIPPMRTSTPRERRKMIGLALETAVLAVMNGHLYSYDNTVRRQKEGRPIGLRLTGVLAKLVMLIWAREFVIILTIISTSIAAIVLYMLKIYVDDVNVITEELPPGIRFKEGDLTVTAEEVESDKLFPGNIQTANLLQEVENSILSYIRFTVDSPSNHADGWMPVLDLKVRVRNNQIQHAHNRKPMCDKRLILQQSVHPDRVKRLTAVCEGVRFLMNTSISLGWQFMSEELTELAARMKNSGYSERLRGEVIRDVTIGWERKLEAAETAHTPMYRPREREQREMLRQKMTQKSAWYRPQADVAAFYPATPGSELIKGIRKVVAEEASRLDLKIRVVERGGVSLKSKLVKSEIRRNSECGAPDCYLDTRRTRRRTSPPCWSII